MRGPELNRPQDACPGATVRAGRRGRRDATAFAAAARAAVFAFALLVSAAAGTDAQQLELADAVRGALEASPELAQSGIRTTIARSRVEDVLDATRPRVSLSAEPGYSLATQRAASFANVASIADFPPEPTTTITQSSGVGLSVRQSLPTSGLLSTSVGASFTASTALGEEEGEENTTTFSLRPSASVSLSQPLFVDGALVDLQEPRLALEQAERGAIESELGELQIRTQLATSVVRLFTQLGQVRRAEALQRRQLELLGRRLTQAEIRREQGQGSQQESFSLQVQINRTQDAMLQTRLAIRELELELSRLTGRRVDGSTSLGDLESADRRLAQAIADRIPGVTLAERVATTALERARTDVALAMKQERATGSVAVTLTPRYMDTRENPDTAAGAFTDYSGDGAGVDVAVSVGVTVPLGEARSRERRVRVAELSEELARSERDRVAANRESELAIVRERERITDERIELLRFEIDFEKGQLENELDLVAIGASTELAADQIRSTIASREGELADLHVQRFLQRVDHARLIGIDVVPLLAGEKQAGE